MRNNTGQHYSDMLFTQAEQYIPGGVNSPVRAFHAVGGRPPVMARGEGAYIIDVDHHRYIDYVGSWGPLIVGHAHPYVVAAMTEALWDGTSFGALCEREVQLAKMIVEAMPSIEKIRFVNSGTEATMTAIRLARGFTRRDKMIKFAGCYHGHSDSLLVHAGSGVLALGIPSSLGVPAAIAAETLVATFNDLDSVARLFREYPDEIAGVIVEPIAGNMNLVRGEPDFLSGLRALCDEAGSVLIFDEVMTGFRVASGGAQSIYRITPDLTTLGKVIGGGMPVGALGGRADIMNQLAPLGLVYQAGTLSGNPICMAAGIATLQLIQAPNFFEALSCNTQFLVDHLITAARSCGLNAADFSADAVGGMFGLYLAPAVFKLFFHGMLAQGVYLAPSPHEVGFMSSAHQQSELNQTIAAATTVFRSL